ncbi:hypothetical protein [Segetibacter sp.]|jgi:beta-galactosidase|uniref:hypothetical protein n=1 Tax=Segetibacter sp. TaxID=2231182 RepID=UPI00262F8329|nr:hypothetical protein [Segetibacter sp.]MCW3080825.1 hypothetical protein [Segetibacter sp.]
MESDKVWLKRLLLCYREILDEARLVIHEVNITVQFALPDNAKMEATGNANLAEIASFKQPKRNTFRGRGSTIVRPRGKQGKAILKAQAQGVNY